jgi:hypothetical protein
MSASTPAIRESSRAKWLDALKEVGIIAAVYLIYSFSRGNLADKTAVAFENARDVIAWEKALGLFVELDIQSFFLKSSILTDLANGAYTYCYYPALFLFALWAYWRHRRKYKVIRTVFVVSAAVAFLIFALYPVAPPRFFDGAAAEDLGFVDTMEAHGSATYGSIEAFYNPYAAMPSCHFAWSLMVCIGILWMTTSWWVKLLSLLLPGVQLVAIVATGNHFVLDAVVGGMLLISCFGLVALSMRLLNRYRHRAPSSSAPPPPPTTFGDPQGRDAHEASVPT